MKRSFDAVVTAILCAATPMFLAGAIGWTVTVVATLTLIAASVVLLRPGQLPLRHAADGAVVLGLVFTGVQALPFPEWAWRSSQREVAFSYELAGLDTGWLPFTYDPGATWEQLVVGASVLLAYSLGRVVANRHGRRAVLVAVATAPCAVVLVSLAHEAVGAETVFGVYRPVYTRPALLGPLINTNHFGGFAAFGSTLTLGLALGRNARLLRGVAAALALACAGAAVASNSRGALLSLAVGTAWVALSLLRRGTSRIRRLFTAGAVVLGVSGAVVYAGLDGRLYHELREGPGDLSKLDLIAKASTVAITHPLMGIGRGAFEPVFARLEGTEERFTHPENLLAQWGAEWGLVVTLALLLLIAPAMIRASNSKRVEVAAGAGALAALVVHDLFDFALEMPGLVVPVAILLGGLVRPKPAPAVQRAHVWAGVAVTAVMIAALAPGIHERRPEHLVELLSRTPNDDIDALVQRAVRVHPLDARIALFAGRATMRTRPRQAARWLNRTMELAPGWASPHVLAADALDRRGATTQALVEVREAVARDAASIPPDLLCRIAERADVDQLMGALATDDARARRVVAQRLVPCVPDSTMDRLDIRILERYPTDVGGLVRRTRRLLRDGDHSGAAALADRAVGADPTDHLTQQTRAVVLRTTAGPEAALAALPEEPRAWSTLVLRAELSAEAGDEERLQRELARLRSLGAGDSSRVASAWSVAGRIEARRGNFGAALAAYERAHRLEPASVEYLRHVAVAAERLGRLPRSYGAWAELCRRGASDACQRARSPDSP